MASFRTHISFGIALGVVSVFALIALALAPAHWSFYLFVALAVVVGAILPDMDSDSGIPFHITFGSLAVIGAALAGFYAWVTVPGQYMALIAYPFTTAFLIWVVIGYLFKRFTRHRGMAHSIPAAALAGLLMYSLANHFWFDGWQSFLLGVAIALGYVLHLVLDEVNSAVNFHGTPFIPNKALGSALKLYSRNPKVTVFVYGLTGLLFWWHSPALIRGMMELIGVLQELV